MLFDQVTDTQMQAGRALTGATMAAFLVAPIFRSQARRVRMGIASLYLAGVFCFVVYLLL
jgi:hypothetical protein